MLEGFAEAEAPLRLAVAGLAGMAVGLEREWSGHASGPGARFAGVRTFTLIGATGGVAGMLLDAGATAMASALFLAMAGLIVAAYFIAASRAPEAVDGTTETAALLMLGAGLLAGLGQLRLASGIAAVTVLLLAEKETIRGFIKRIGREEMQAALQFAVLALVVLPLLPEGPFGPYGGIRPRALWMVVLIFSGVNFAGYLAARALGDSKGYIATGALGGLVSSTAVTLTFARKSREDEANAGALATGTIAACTVLILRILVVLLVLNAALAPGVGLGVLPMLLLGAAAVAIGMRGDRSAILHDRSTAPGNPLRLGSAILMAIGFQLVLTLLTVLKDLFGDVGVMASAAIAGLTDMDALTLAMSRLADDSSVVGLAAKALVLGIVVNTAFKAALALVLGSPGYRTRTLPALVAIGAAGVAGIWLIRGVLGDPQGVTP